MARTVLTKTNAKGNFISAGQAVTMAVADVANGNQFAASGNDLLIAHNSGAAPYTVTISSTPDPTFGRSGDIAAESLAAGEVRVFGPFRGPGWKQADGNIYVNANNIAVKLGVVNLPG